MFTIFKRPGSVERKIQEDTVVLFYKLLQDYGKESLEILDEKEKEYRDLKKIEKERAVNCENILQLHTASFYGPLSKSEGKTNRIDRLQRLGRSRSMPKMTPEEVCEIHATLNKICYKFFILRKQQNVRK